MVTACEAQNCYRAQCCCACLRTPCWFIIAQPCKHSLRILSVDVEPHRGWLPLYPTKPCRPALASGNPNVVGFAEALHRERCLQSKPISFRSLFIVRVVPSIFCPVRLCLAADFVLPVADMQIMLAFIMSYAPNCGNSVTRKLNSFCHSYAIS